MENKQEKSGIGVFLDNVDMTALSEAAKKQGFPLEYDVKETFSKNRFMAEQNFSLEGEYPAVDVVAYRNGTVFICECKGSAPDNILLLFGNSKDFITADRGAHMKTFQGITHRPLPQLYYERESGCMYDFPSGTHGQVILICAQDCPVIPAALRHCYSGDFRKNKPPYNQTAKSNEKNNLFKGISQLKTDVKNIETIITKIADGCASLRIIPLIVTNVQIFICENGSDKLIPVNWTVYDCDSEALQYAFIVNRSFLEEFIQLWG